MAGVIALLLAAVVAVGSAGALRDVRRMARMNRAIHELRRPLQSISLALSGPAPDLGCAGACLEQARIALDGLDASVNGRRSEPVIVRTALAEIVAALERRWRFADVRVEAPDPDLLLDADPAGLGAALDNLVWNALSHGSGPIYVRASTTSGTARFEVRDGGPRAGARKEPCGDPRHGHGLRVVDGIASDHGGTVVAPSRTVGGGTLAGLSLPALRDRRS